MPVKPFGHPFSPRGYLPVYSVVRMCGPNNPIFHLKMALFFRVWNMNIPLFREGSISVGLKWLSFHTSICIGGNFEWLVY